MAQIPSYLNKLLFSPVSIAPLAVFRVIFGGMMCASVIRFAIKGWIKELYIEPRYFFSYHGFEWVQPLDRLGMYVLFSLMGVAALGVMLGAFYRVSALMFFLIFSYIELIDKTYYLNHYYFVSLVSCLLICLPANRAFSVDVKRRPDLQQSFVPAWNLNILKFQIGVVYVFAGLAKLNSEWLLRAMPLKMWLPAKSDLPLLGPLLETEWAAYGFSWAGMLYDLLIVFFLLYPPTRVWAYMGVLAFHMMTALLFQIGMFPYIMSLAALIFFSPAFHQKIIYLVSGEVHRAIPVASRWRLSSTRGRLTAYLLGSWVAIQVLIPFRYLLYPGNLFWHEEGYRFSWRVMLMEKAGYTVFNVHDPQTGKFEQANNHEYLTPVQEKMMSTQPDMILQFAHYLEEVYREKGFVDPAITVESFVTLNGRRSQRFINPQRDLTLEPPGLRHKSWVLPLSATPK